MPPNTSLLSAIAVDLVAVAILAGPLYFRRHRRKDLMLAYVALNVGVLGVSLALARTEVGIGLGLGLFGVLSIVRLRSDQISQAEIAYYFSALALGLLGGIGMASPVLSAGFAAVVLVVLYVVDHPRLIAAHRRVLLNLDRAYLDEQSLRVELAERLGGTVTRVEILETDLVRETTRVDVRYRLARRPAPVAVPPGAYGPVGAVSAPAGTMLPGFVPNGSAGAGPASVPAGPAGALYTAPAPYAAPAPFTAPAPFAGADR